jgi:hypothetical protein
VDERTRRIGETQALFREVNERVYQLDRRFGTIGIFEILCECGSDGCFERIPIDRDAYASIRSDALAFAVVPGHEIESVEGVIERHDRYNVLRKNPGEPARVAEEADPR